jgi:translocation and assembly module TamB
VHVQGELANIDNVLVDVSVDRFDVRLFDFPVRNPDDPKRPGYRVPIRLALDRHSVRIVDMRLEGVDTTLSIGGNVDLHNEMIAMRFDGEANLRILEGFTRNVRSTGRAKVGASLQGSMRDPSLNGNMTVSDGRIRHFSLPHALDNINGVIAFDSRGITLDDVTAEIGEGPVTFEGSIGIENYWPGRIDVSIRGENMNLRYPQSTDAWLRANVEAMLDLRGSADAMTLSGDVTVHDALYRKNFSAGGNLFDFGQSTVAVTSTSSFVAPTLPLSYDVHINAPGTVRVENNWVQKGTLARVDVQLRGTYAQPLLLGNVDVERGDVIFEGRRYQIRRAAIQFNNSIEPFFDLEAGARIRVPGETYNVTVTASGFDPVSAIRFSSDPELPEYELLALLFSDIAPGRNVEFRQYAGATGGVTPQEQLFRERVTRALTGVVSSEISRAFQEALDVEAVQLTASILDPNVQSARLEPAARVTILKRVNSRTYLTYSRSLSSSTRDQVILLEFDQTDQLSWVLSRNEDGTYALDVRFRRTF